MSDQLVRLGSNENLLGPSPLALEAIRELSAEAHFYPVDDDLMLMEKLAAAIGGGLSVDQFVIGNGSSDVLRMIVQTYVLPENEVLFPLPTFAIYKRLTTVHRGKVVTVPLKEYQIDLEALLNAINDNTALIVLCNPNNPTGYIIKHDELALFLEKVPKHVLVVLDEAYYHFVDDPDFPRVTELIAAGHNLITTRTFSKVYGLASLRIGYGFGKKELVEKVKNSRHVSETGMYAYRAAAAALTDEVHIVNTIEMVKNGRNYLYKELSKLGLEYLESQAFYVLLKNLPVEAEYLVAEARKHNVIIRHTDIFDMPGYVRISVGRPEDNRQAIEVLRKILN